MTAAGAVGAAEFDRCLRPLLAGDKPGAIAVAVSGGADSMALALLTADWAKKRRIAVVPLIVDHRLRPESTREARHVAGLLRKAGLTPKLLTWDAKTKPAANRQALAREARYDLLGQECAKQGVRHLLLAHHRDDQAETLLLRALRGSGVDGLAAMQPRSLRGENLILLRPLLEIPKARLVATLQKRKQLWVEDPSNANASFQRVRVRAALDLLSDNDAAHRAELVQHLAQTAKNFARTRALLDAAAYDLLHDSVQLTPAGCAWLDPAGLVAAEDELSLRALVKLLGAIGGISVPPRLDGLQRLLEAFRSGKSLPLTLHRCLLTTIKGENRLLVCREARYLPATQPLQSMLWDGRFRIAVAKPLRGISIAPLGKAKKADDWPPVTAELLPKVAWPALPALRRTGDGRLLAVPGLNWGQMPANVTISFQPALPAAFPA